MATGELSLPDFISVQEGNYKSGIGGHLASSQGQPCPIKLLQSAKYTYTVDLKKEKMVTQ